MKQDWQIKKFVELTPKELYELIRLRVDVFVVEQCCPYPELDGKDCHDQARHIFARNQGVIACARVLPPGVSFPGVSLGRVAVAKSFRGQGLARSLVAQALGCAADHWPGIPVEIGAQAYLQDFYRSVGFTPVSDLYLEDNIPHIDMVLNRS